MSSQNYSNHKRNHTAYYLVAILTIAAIAGAIRNSIRACQADADLYDSVLLLLITLILAFVVFFMRHYALKAQDRAIRAEENLRHFALTGKLLDPRLTIRQVIALRFAPDAEFVSLAEKAAVNNLSTDDIKKEISNWRGDHYRV